LSDELQNSPQHRNALGSVAKKLEAEFNQQVQHPLDLGGKYGEAQRLIFELQKQRDISSSAIKNCVDSGRNS
jgi:hypothetical protein